MKRLFRRRPRDPFAGGYRLVALGGEWSVPISDDCVRAIVGKIPR